MIKNILIKNLTKEYREDFENSSKCWNCANDYIENDFKLRDHFQITGKHRGSARRDFSFNVEFNHKIPIVFHNLKKL